MKKDRSIYILIAFFAAAFIIYFISSPGETPYDYFGRLSYAFAGGKVYLEQNPPWLNELVPVNGKYYIVYPPMPSVLMTPFTFLFQGKSFQTFFSIVLGSINVCLVYILMQRLKFSRKTSFVVTIFFGFGTNHWYLASIGSSWFIAHIVALFFLLLALIETFGKRRLWLIGFLVGASFWARTTVIFTVPFFYIYLHREFWPINRGHLLNIFWLNFYLGLFILLDAYYNYLRFENFSPFTAYNLIPGIENDPIFKDGFINAKFIPRHIEAILLKIPKLTDKPPYVIPSLYASAIWFTSPLLIYVIRFKKQLLTLACWVGVIIPLGAIMMWAGVGYAQFGYRFAQDFMPFLLILTALGIGQKPGALAYTLLTLSILVNTWGVVMINKLNLWTMS